MRRYLILALAIFAAQSCYAQQTTVTATVTDPSSHPYYFLTGYASLVCPGNQAPTFNGYSMPRTFVITGGDGNGTFTQVLYDLNQIAPSGCGYQWHITWKDGVTSFITGSITSVTGSSVNESAAISAFSVPLPPPPTGILLETNGTTNTVQSTLNLLNGTGISLSADGSGGVTITNVNPVNLSATSPIVVSPNPITSTGTVSCPTCNTSSATIAGTITSTHIPYASGGNTLSDIIGSSVNGGTGAITLTASADTTTPLTISKHSSTQSASLVSVGDPISGLAGSTSVPTGIFATQSIHQNTTASPKDTGVVGIVEADNGVDSSTNRINGGYFSANSLTTLYSGSGGGILNGVQGIGSASHTTGTAGQILGGLFTANLNAAGAVSDLSGLAAQSEVAGSGLATIAAAIHIYTPTVTGGTPPTGEYGLYTNAINGGVSNWGVFVSNQVQDAVHWAIQTGTGKSEFGDQVILHGHINQSATGTIAGTCAMSTGTSCTFSMGVSFTSTPICIATQQSATLTGGAVGCTVSGTTVTITSAVANSETWGALLIGNPN